MEAALQLEGKFDYASIISVKIKSNLDLKSDRLPFWPCVCQIPVPFVHLNIYIPYYFEAVKTIIWVIILL